MVGSLWTGISGLSTHQAALDNESHNIANVNTIGYKASRISFADQMYQDTIGKGSKVLDAEKIYSQGSMKATGVSYDLALEGSGFFAVKDPNATGSVEEYYTRAGNLRMGDSGNLQDSNLYDVIGWSVSPIDVDNDVVSTNPNITKFTNDYVKIAANQLIQKDSSIETITGKLTDYTSSAMSDDDGVMSGLGMKSMSSKIRDVEILITDYQTRLKEYANDPTANSTPSIAQETAIKLPTSSTSQMSTASDQIYIYISGEKITQSFIEVTASEDLDGGGVSSSDDLIASKIATYKALADQISQKSGLSAYIADPAKATASTPTYQRVEGAEATYSSSVNTNPVLVIESLKPGEEFVVGDVAEYIANDSSLVPGGKTTVTTAIQGSGFGAVQSAREALLELATGYQRDVWEPADLSNLTGFGDSAKFTIANPDDPTAPFTVEMSIDVNNTSSQVLVTTDGSDTTSHTLSTTSFTDATKVDAMVEAINSHSEMAKLITAHNYNGKLVVETIDGKPGDTFVSSLTTNAQQTEVVTSTTSLPDGSTTATTMDVTLPSNLAIDERLELTFTVSGTTYTAVAQEGETAWNVTSDGGATWTAGGTALTAALDKDNMEDAIATILGDYATDAANITTSAGAAGDTVTITNNDGNSYSSISINTKPVTTSLSNQNKNTELSINSGADAEFIEMINRLDQTAARDSLQLRLDNLGISDSAFGEFSVSSNGLISMKQDGVEFAVGQVSIAMFNNERGLTSEGNNLVSKTNDSGNPIFNINNDKAAKVASKTLELSTADLSESLVNLMVFQRAFEANSKSITTSDQILTTLIQLKK